MTNLAKLAWTLCAPTSYSASRSMSASGPECEVPACPLLRLLRRVSWP